MQVKMAHKTLAETLQERAGGSRKTQARHKFTELPELLVQNKDLQSLTPSEGIT